MHNQNSDNLLNEFSKLYGDNSGVSMFFSPGRVNLIGEHVDYNGGHVFPCALDFGTIAAARTISDKTVRLSSLNIDGKYEIDLNDLIYRQENGWTNFVIGIIKEYIERGFDIGGFEMLISGSIPHASGLSSSASIELLTCVTLNHLFGCDIETLEMVKLSQHSENTFCKVNCGIMDQFSIGFGKRGHAMLLDCGSLNYEYVPVALEGCELVIGNTNKRRELADSKYNERRAECDEAVRLLNAAGLKISLLAEVSPEELESYKYAIPNETIMKRAKHVVHEIRRTKEAVTRLRNNDIAGFGQLMNESHSSLRDLYEVTGAELDAMVSAAWKAEGVIGSRMTGAGFGGCTVSIVRKESVSGFIKSIGTEYRRVTGLTADFYIAGIGDGAGLIG